MPPSSGYRTNVVLVHPGSSRLSKRLRSMLRTFTSGIFFSFDPLREDDQALPIASGE
jgi:hypothetical protein